MLISSVWRERSISYFSAGLVVGGIAVATFASLLGQIFIQSWVPSQLAWGGIGVLMFAVAAHEFGVLSLPLPQNARQVPERVVEAGPRFGAFQFGVEMGTGMRTFVTSAQPYVLLALVLVIASPAEAVLAGAGFGIGRSLVPVARHVTGMHDAWSAAFARRYLLLRLSTLAALGGAVISIFILADSTF